MFRIRAVFVATDHGHTFAERVATTRVRAERVDLDKARLLTGTIACCRLGCLERQLCGFREGRVVRDRLGALRGAENGCHGGEPVWGSDRRRFHGRLRSSGGSASQL